MCCSGLQACDSVQCILQGRTLMEVMDCPFRSPCELVQNSPFKALVTMVSEADFVGSTCIFECRQLIILGVV